MSVAWVTGARGFLGRNLAQYLSAQGRTVAGLGHGQWPVSEAGRFGVEYWLNGGLSGANLDILATAAGLPDTIFHLAGGSSVGSSVQAPLEDFTRTVEAGARLFEWIRTRSPDTRVVVVSSAAVYGAGHVGRIPVTAPLRPFSPYGSHKLMLEQLARSYASQYDMRFVVVRLFSVYGPWLYKQLLWDLCSRLSQGCEVLDLGGDGGELRDWTEVDDVVRFLSAVPGSAGPDVAVLNGGSGRGTPVATIAQLAVDAWGRDVPIRFSGLSRQGDPYSLIAEPDVGTGEFPGWRVTVEEGIGRYVRWFRSQLA